MVFVEFGYSSQKHSGRCFVVAVVCWYVVVLALVVERSAERIEAAAVVLPVLLHRMA